MLVRESGLLLFTFNYSHFYRMYIFCRSQECWGSDQHSSGMLVVGFSYSGR